MKANKNACRRHIKPWFDLTQKNCRKELYIGTHAAQTVGWSATKSNAFLQDLSDHATQFKFVYRHAWRAHDLVMWANTRAVHRRCPGISPRSPAY